MLLTIWNGLSSRDTIDQVHKKFFRPKLHLSIIVQKCLDLVSSIPEIEFCKAFLKQIVEYFRRDGAPVQCPDCRMRASRYHRLMPAKSFSMFPTPTGAAKIRSVAIHTARKTLCQGNASCKRYLVFLVSPGMQNHAISCRSRRLEQH